MTTELRIVTWRSRPPLPDKDALDFAKTVIITLKARRRVFAIRPVVLDDQGNPRYPLSRWYLEHDREYEHLEQVKTNPDFPKLLNTTPLDWEHRMKTFKIWNNSLTPTQN